MLIIRFSFLLFFILNINCQIIPQRFNGAINQLLRQQAQQDYTSFDINDYVDYNVTSQNMLEQMSLLFSKNQTTACERDFELILQAASKRDMWALKVIDAWGKPLPSGVFSGNIYWVGNYDECLQEMYLTNNKSFVSQPFNTQYCKYSYLFSSWIINKNTNFSYRYIVSKTIKTKCIITSWYYSWSLCSIIM